MRNYWVRILLLICIGLQPFTCPVFASNNAGAILRRDMDARVTALGQTGAAIPLGAASQATNPATLTMLDHTELILSTSHLFETHYLSLSAATHFFDMPWGIHVVSAQSNGSQESQLNSQGRYVPTGRTLDYSATSFQLSTAFPLFDTLSVGTTATAIFETAAQFHAQGFGLNVALAYHPNPSLYASIAAQNIIQPHMKWDTPSRNIDTVPKRLRPQIGLFLIPDTLFIATGVDLIENQPETWHGGIEYQLHPTLALRAGVYGRELSFGVGLNLHLFEINSSFTSQQLDFIDHQYKFSITLLP